MTDRQGRFKNFPQDDRLWWIRWIDRYRFPHGTSQAPSVDVLLSLLPVETQVASEAKVDQAHIDTNDWLFTPILSGAIPGLRIGSVYKNGIPSGDLRAKYPTFTFERHRTKCSILPASRKLTTEIQRDTPGNSVLAPYEYRLVNYEKRSPAPKIRINYLHAHCVVLQQADVTLIIPCHEVFRSLYAPHQRIAEALLAGPWDHNCEKVVKGSDTYIQEDGVWRLVLDKFVPDEFILWVANLVLGKEGKEAARLVYTNRLMANPGHLKVGIPFKWDTLKLTVRAWRLRTDPPKFLAIELAEVNWPDPTIEIRYERENSGLQGRTHTSIDQPPPLYWKEKDVDQPPAPVDIYSADDPEESSKRSPFAERRLKWLEEPTLIKFTRESSHSYEGGGKIQDEEALQGASPGVGVGTKTGLGRTEFIGRHETSKRMDDIAEMLDLLRNHSEIEQWSIVSCHSRSRLIDNREVWLLPEPERSPGSRKTKWIYVDSKCTHRRHALVCEIVTESRIVYWVEVQCNANSLKSLIFTTESYDLETLLYKILAICVRFRGIWSKAESELLEAGVGAFLPWQHSYIKKTHKLNHRRAIAAIKKIIRY